MIGAAPTTFFPEFFHSSSPLLFFFGGCEASSLKTSANTSGNVINFSFQFSCVTTSLLFSTTNLITKGFKISVECMSAKIRYSRQFEIFKDLQSSSSPSSSDALDH